MSIVLDAGPALNFLAVGQQNVLIQMAAAAGADLAAPKRIDDEIEGQSKSNRFRRTAVRNTWRTLKSSGRITLLDDSLLRDPRFDAAIGRISGVEAADRKKTRKNLGEILVLAHASVFVQDGETVYVLMDESDGRRRAKSERAWLRQQRAPGQLVLWNTQEVLEAAERQPGWITGGLTAEQVYKAMKPFDDGITV